MKMHMVEQRHTNCCLIADCNQGIKCLDVSGNLMCANTTLMGMIPVP